MKLWPGWLPLLLWGMVACAPTPDQISDINLPAVLGSLASTATPTPVAVVTPTPAPITDRIAFISTRPSGGAPDIYVMNSDGSGLARLTDHPASDTSPAWSPDRRRIAFVSDRSGLNQIYLMEADGGNQQPLTDQPEGAAAPAWAPDGQQIAFIAGSEDKARLAILNQEDEAVTFLDIPLTGLDQPAWAPDGLKLAVVAPDPDRGGGQDIFLVNVESPQQPINLTHHPGDDEAPAWSPDGQRIAFQSDREGNDDVYVMYANGSAQTPLTDQPGFDGQPSWAGDSRRLVFVSDRDGKRAIYIMADNGGEATALTAPSLEAGLPAWQPPPPAPVVDTLVYAAASTGLHDLYTIGVNGANENDLTRNPGVDSTMPAWSPDGTQIAFASNQAGDYDIFILPLAGAQGQTQPSGSVELSDEPINLTNQAGKDLRPTWSPDGGQLAFESDRSGQWQVWLMASDGSSQRQLTNGSADSGNPAWSPDGSQIAFASNRTGNFDIYLLNADGSGEVLNLTNTPANEFNPAWAPQGDLLVFRSDQDETHQIYVVNADGTGLQRLLFTQADDDEPAWSPDGSQIAFISNRALGSEGRRNRQPNAPYALYVYDLKTRATNLVAGEGDMEFRYPSWKPRARGTQPFNPKG